jgi:hypothetical protein
MYEVPLFHIILQKIPGEFISFYTHAKYSANFIFFLIYSTDWPHNKLKVTDNNTFINF